MIQCIYKNKNASYRGKTKELTLKGYSFVPPAGDRMVFVEPAFFGNMSRVFYHL